MEIIYLYSNNIFKNKMSNDTNLVATIGAFDGIHKGHKLIFDRLKKEAFKLNAKTVVFTFDPHPDYVLSKRENKGYLLPLDERVNAFRHLGIDYCCIIKCDETLVKIPYQEFNSRFLAEINTIVVGEDFRYGYMAKGSPETLKEVCNRLIVVNLLKDDKGEKIGSEEVREFLKSGNIQEANKLLLQPYSIAGVVEKGKSVGTSLNIKIATFKIGDNEFPIKNGIYQCYAIIDDKKYMAICNLGVSITSGCENKRIIEAHILNIGNDDNYDLIDKFIIVQFVRYLKEDVKYASLDELKKQILKDMASFEGK